MFIHEENERKMAIKLHSTWWQHLGSLTLLQRSKHKTMFIMTCWNTSAVVRSLQDHGQCVSTGGGEDHFPVISEKVWPSLCCVSSSLAMVFTKVRKQMAATQFCHTVGMFSEVCQLWSPKATLCLLYYSPRLLRPIQCSTPLHASQIVTSRKKQEMHAAKLVLE